MEEKKEDKTSEKKPEPQTTEEKYGAVKPETLPTELRGDTQKGKK